MVAISQMFSDFSSRVGFCGEITSDQFTKQEVLDTSWKLKKLEQEKIDPEQCGRAGLGKWPAMWLFNRPLGLLRGEWASGCPGQGLSTRPVTSDGGRGVGAGVQRQWKDEVRGWAMEEVCKGPGSSLCVCAWARVCTCAQV